MDGEFRRITPQNISELSEIYRSYAGNGLKEEMVILRSSGYPAWVYYEEGRAIAFFYCFHFAPDILELANIFISQAHRSKGLGVKLLGRLFNDLVPPFRYVIAVNSTLNDTNDEKGNPENFYIRNGFKRIAETDNSVVFWGALDGQPSTI